MKLNYTLMVLLTFNLCAKHYIRHVPCSSLKEGDVTIYIHGTLFPTFTTIGRKIPPRMGLWKYTKGPTGSRRYLAKELGKADPTQFPEESFYKFYWSGSLSFYERKQAAKKLLKLLKNHKGNVTIIAHSHGCNVALNLAELDQTLSIEKLILLAAPVQDDTKELVHSPVFGSVYSFYSAGDVVQTADPQWFHTKNTSPFFSERTYCPGDTIHQARILLEKKNPGHNDFNGVDFFKRIPQLLKLLNEAHKKQVVINIPKHPKKPYVLDNEDNLPSKYSSKLFK